ncbi:MAG: hypothetical protein ABI557_08905 [Aureliella sp.]
MDVLQQHLKEIDGYLDSASVSMADLTDAERKLANDLCSHFELPLGTLLRRANAIRLAGGHDNFSQSLREGARHLIFRSG